MVSSVHADLFCDLQDQIRQHEGQIAAQKAAAELQIKQSEQNLAAQYQSLIQQQQVGRTIFFFNKRGKNGKGLKTGVSE